MRFKKYIIIICLFTFLFFPMLVKYEEPKAEILTLTTGTIIACAALATAVGVVITDPNMIEDIGTLVYDGIKEIPNTIETIGNNIKINVTKNLLDTVVGICNTISKTDKIVDKIIETSLDHLGSVYTCAVPNLYSSLTFYSYGANCIYISKPPTFSGKTFHGFCSMPEGYHTASFEYSDKLFKVFVDGQQVASQSSSSIYDEISFVMYLKNGETQVKFRPVLLTSNESVCIPYTEKNTENVSADKPIAYFPTGSGSISVPVDKPYTDFNPSIDNPISFPSDLVGDGIVADKPIDKPDDGVIDKPNDGVIDTPSEGILSNILDFLKSIFISDNVKDIDFSPLYFSVSEKFPFSIPFDLINLIKEFEAEKKEPKFFIDMSSFSSNKYSRGEVGFWLDFTQFDEIIDILRTLILIIFMFFIALKTRNIIKG